MIFWILDEKFQINSKNVYYIVVINLLLYGHIAMPYIVYQHTINNKIYIGYTKISLVERLKQHIKLANSGSRTYFCKAIRKYGPENISSKVLFTTDSVNKATNKEKFYIKKLKATDPKIGYNLTNGGDGGNCTLYLSKTKRDKWIKKLSKNTTGSNNPNHSGISDDKLIDIAVEYFKTNKSLGCLEWRAYSKNNNLPQNFSKNRFNGSFKCFVEQVKKKLTIAKIAFTDNQFNNSKNSYSLSSRQKQRLSSLGKRWYNDSIKSYLLLPKDIKIKELKLKLGRINVKNRKIE